MRRSPISATVNGFAARRAHATPAGARPPDHAPTQVDRRQTMQTIRLDRLKGLSDALPESMRAEIDRLQQRIDGMNAGAAAPVDETPAGNTGGGSGT
jgi:hypothetical protein